MKPVTDIGGTTVRRTVLWKRCCTTREPSPLMTAGPDQSNIRFAATRSNIDVTGRQSGGDSPARLSLPVVPHSRRFTCRPTPHNWATITRQRPNGDRILRWSRRCPGPQPGIVANVPPAAVVDTEFPPGLSSSRLSRHRQPRRTRRLRPRRRRRNPRLALSRTEFHLSRSEPGTGPAQRFATDRQQSTPSVPLAAVEMFSTAVFLKLSCRALRTSLVIRSS